MRLRTKPYDPVSYCETKGFQAGHGATMKNSREVVVSEQLKRALQVAKELAIRYNRPYIESECKTAFKNKAIQYACDKDLIF